MEYKILLDALPLMLSPVIIIWLLFRLNTKRKEQLKEKEKSWIDKN